MLEFRTQYDRKEVFSVPGEFDHPDYQLRVDSKGKEELVEIGRIPTYQQIQSFKDSTDINLIMARYAMGESDVLMQRQGAYFDATVFPKTFAEMLDSITRGEQIFNSLPLDIRKEFNFDFRQWIAAMDDMTDWNRKMNISEVDRADPAPDQKEVDDNA